MVGALEVLSAFPVKKFSFGIDNSVILARDRDATSDVSSGFSMSEAGLDARHPIGLTIRNRKLDGGLFFVASRFFNRVDFLRADAETERVKRIFTVGLTISVREGVPIWKLNFDRVGVDYRWGNAGFRGIGFNLGFPF